MGAAVNAAARGRSAGLRTGRKLRLAVRAAQGPTPQARQPRAQRTLRSV